MIENLFWESFCETGKIDMYMLYRESSSEDNTEKPNEKEYPKESLESNPWEAPLT